MTKKLQNKNLFFAGRFLLLTLCGLLISPIITFSQCKSIAKKCTPELAPFIYTGQLNSTNLFEGESAELVMAFTGGQKYRILACAAANLGKLRIVIYDSKRQMLFNNKDHDNAQAWDLNVGTTEDYTIQISIPNSKSQKAGDIVMNGCVAVLVGFKNE